MTRSLLPDPMAAIPFAWPLTLVSDSVMSEDYLSTSSLLVDAVSARQAAVFQTDQDTEALVVSQGCIQHVFRDPGTESGWNRVALFDGTAHGQEVVVGLTTDGVAHGFYQDGTNLYHTSLDAGTWSGPDALTLCTSLRIVYDLNHNLILYGRAPGTVPTGGQTITVSEDDGGWVATTGAGGAWPGQLMYYNSQENGIWWMAAPAAYGLVVASQSGGEPIAQLTLSEPASQVMFGYEPYPGSVSFIYLDEGGGLNVAAGIGYPEPASIPLTTMTVTSVAGLVDTDNLLHLYFVDDNQTLWVLHQTGVSTENGYGVPTWAPSVALDSNVAAVYSDSSPTDSTNLFVLDAADGALRYHSQDPTTFGWNTSVVLLPATDTYQVTRYRTEAALVDANGVPVTNYPISVTSDSACDIWVTGTTFSVNSTQPAGLTTDAFGKVTLATLATSAHTPALTFTFLSGGTTLAVVAQPDAALRSYLSTPGAPLNDLPPFTAATLETATLPARAVRPNQPLAPGLGLGGPTADEAVSLIAGILTTASQMPPGGITVTLGPPPGVGGSLLAARPAAVGGIFGDIDRLAKDALHGLETAAAKVATVTVDAAQEVVSAVHFVSDGLTDALSFTVNSVEDAVSVVHGVFQAIGAMTQDVLDWLKAMFNWSDIWDTKTALQNALGAMGSSLTGQLESLNNLAQGGFSALETLVTSQFATLKESVAPGQTVNGTVPSSGAPPVGASASASGAQAFANQTLFTATVNGTATSVTAAHFTARAHHNWFLDKVMAFFAGPRLPVFETLATPFLALASAVGNAAGDLEQAATDLWSAVADPSLLNDPSTFARLGLYDLLDAAEHLVAAALTFADGVFTALFDVALAVTGLMDQVWTVQVPGLGALVNFVHSLVEPGSSDLDVSIADVFCLVAAVPITLVYKILNGADAQLFPGGQLPAADSATSEGCKFTSVGLQVGWSLYNTALDAVQADNTILDVINFVFLTLSQVFSWPGGDTNVPFSAVPLSSDGDKAAFANWMVGWSFFLVDFVGMFGNGSEEAPAWQQGIARYSDVGDVVDSALGEWNLIAGVAEIVLNQEYRGDLGAIAANLLGPLSYGFQFLTMDAVKGATDSVSVVVKMLIDYYTGLATAVGMADG